MKHKRGHGGHPFAGVLMRAAWAAALGCWLVSGVQAQPAQGAGAALLPALAELRAEGCNGRRTQAPLRAVPQLDEAARRLAGGTPAAQAMRAAGYRAQRSVQLRLGGHGSVDAVRRTVARHYCESLANPRLTELGAHRAGGAWSIILAEPFTPPAAGQAEAVAAEVLALVNSARAEPRRCGSRSFSAAQALRLDDRLRQAAAAHAQEMARHGFMSHQGRDGSEPSERITRTGYRWRTVGENVAAGQTTAGQVVQEWLRSPGHCANLMNPEFTEMGVAFAANRESPAGVYWAQAFGRPR